MKLSLLMRVMAGCLIVPAAVAAGWDQPWLEPQDSAAAAADSDEYAWRLFVALNWPADPATGAADPNQKLGAGGPVVWEYWRSAKAIFLEGGADPGPWLSPANAALPAGDRFDGLPLDPQAPARHIVNGVMTPVTDPIAVASHLGETRMNRRSYDFIRERRLYNLDGQLESYRAGRTVSFPAESRHIKLQWRPIDPGRKSRYYTVSVTMADGSRRLYGLTAVHIATKDLPNWFWATFEQVDNPAVLNAAWLLKSQDRFACAGLAADCNRAPRGIGLEGTVWENYRLRGTMTGFVDPDGKPGLLANSQLESGVQQTTSSCITCHLRASIGEAGGKPARLALFEDGGGSGPGKGFYGWPAPEWFGGGGGEDSGRRLYLPLDSVWSLQRARDVTVH